MTLRVLPGDVFGRLTVLEAAATPPGHPPQRYYRCRCECGGEKVTTAGRLNGGATHSCGCLAREIRSAANRTHGKSRSSLYQLWEGMHQRCRDENARNYCYYGARGITVCERWADFENFLADMGERPEGRSLDRIDNDGNYEPSNCRWATAKEQRANQRRVAAA